MKEFKIAFSPSAITDVKEASRWYNSQQKGLGKKFKTDLKQTIDS